MTLSIVLGRWTDKKTVLGSENASGRDSLERLAVYHVLTGEEGVATKCVAQKLLRSIDDDLTEKLVPH